MKKLALIIPLVVFIELVLSLMFSLLVNLLWWIGPFIIVVWIGNYITRIVINSSADSVTNSQETEEIAESNPVKLSVRQQRRRKQREKRLGLGTSNDNKPIDLQANLSTDIPNNLISIDNISDYITTDFKSIDFNKLSTINYIHSLNNKNVTKIFSLKMSKFYVIDETLFNERNMMNDEEFCDYRLYKVMKTNQNSDVHTADEEMTDDDLTQTLFVTEQRTKHGVILNNNVYITYEKWNTLLPLDKEMYSCTVCQLQCDMSTASGHMESASHLRNLNACRPLKRFDLSIIRKINENFHCGVCNAVFHISSYREHENSKTHEENLLFSINKVSDMAEDLDKKTTQKFNASNIQEPNNAPCTVESIWPGNFWPNYESVETDEIESVNESSEESIRNYSNFENVFGSNVYRNIKIYEEDEIQEYNLPIEGVSYASMASKPKLDVPKFLKIDLGTKEVRVKFEYWHMITPTNPKELYCMVCLESILLRHKREHCLTERHMELLANCAVVNVFEDYLIRDVSDKLYHCGHCNNLQYKNDIQTHIEKYHPINPKQRLLKLPSTDTITVENVKRSINQDNIEKPVKSIKNLDIFGHFKFAPFGVDMTVSNLACHTIMMVVNRYYCAICDVFIQGELIQHVYEVTHMQLINMTPFIKPFQCNLTRAVRGSLHCSLCNLLVPVDGIEGHNIGTSHTDQLAIALGMVKKERPKQEVKYHREEPREFKTELDKFLATLPPDTRGVLSRLKVKNHKGEMFELSDTSSGSTETPDSLSSNNSPIHRPDYKPILNYPKTGVEPTSGIINYPKTGVEPTSGLFNYPKTGVEPTGVVNYPKKGLQTIYPGNVNFPKKETDIIYPGLMQNEVYSGPKQVIYPKGGVEGINVSNAVFKGQMIPLSVLESSLGVKTDTTDRRQEDLAANGLTSSNKQSIEFKTIAKDERTEKSIEVKIKNDFGKTKVPEKTTEIVKMSETDSDEEEPPFVPDEIVLLKLKSSYFKVTSSAYHSLVSVGSARHCFLCSSRLTRAASTEHVRSRKHLDTIKANKFLQNFCGQLFRQMYRMYHCAICNVTMSRKEVRMHLEWQHHIERYDAACKKLSKKVLKDMLKHAKEVCVETQKEFVHSNSPEAPHIITYVQSTRKDCVETSVQQNFEKKAQIIILEGNMMKINFESYHGILVTKSGVKCIICQQEITQEELQKHIETKYHSVALGITFVKQFYPALIRKIIENTVNCVICNLELLNDESLIFEHICGRKHVKNHRTIIEKTSHTDSYSDCYKFPISL